MYTSANKLNYEGQSVVAHILWVLTPMIVSLMKEVPLNVRPRFSSRSASKVIDASRPLLLSEYSWTSEPFSLPSTGLCVGRDEVMKDRSDPLSCSLIARDTVGSRVEVEITRGHREVDASGTQ